MKPACLVAMALWLWLGAAVAFPQAASAAGNAPGASATNEVYTRAVVRSFSRDGDRHYIHLKIAPGTKIPFSTLTFRVLDPKLVEGLREGENVGFRAERRDGENVLTAIRGSSSR